ncbi:methionine-rich copper-binding protein CopC [Streptomyces sp. PvR006]|uniref:copper resistance CopC family protein n=1 Tax=unclassified Streptomyces TaxID=2593676 RepID=UPI001AE5D840|nr:copper resistance CopC family protein [Streptomyces sp. PvR006]MBP2580032.1 methionine-rich copper-binding protein CopC [Streptomyces sp. PvR006]
MHPPTPGRRAVRRTARALILPLALTVTWAAAPPAAAHTDLVSSSPARGASLDRPPTAIRLTFSDEMTERYAKVALTAPDGSAAAGTGLDVSGRTATLPVEPGLAAGTYTVGYRVVSADGHPVAGSFAFTVERPLPTPTPTPSPRAPSQAPAPPSTRAPSSPPAPPSTPPPSSTQGAPRSEFPAAAALSVLGAAVVVSAGAVVARRRRSRHDR